MIATYCAVMLLVMSGLCIRQIILYRRRRRRERQRRADYLVYVGRPPSAEEIEAALPSSICKLRVAHGGAANIGAAAGAADQVDCSICLEEFKEGQRFRFLPACSHTFHAHCVDSWLAQLCASSPTGLCPSCRTPVGLSASQWTPVPFSSIGTSGSTTDRSQY
ncbi:hypothetical protein L7F22_055782 [Adiantum nelumboides]|nr:hypothetical protein [Adiantum nelumboides]